MPTGHDEHALDDDAPVIGLNVPAGQLPQVELATAETAVLNVPAAQAVHELAPLLAPK